MSEDISQEELEQRVLIAFYRFAQESGGELIIADIQRMLDGNFGIRRIELAVRALANADLLEGSYYMDRPSAYEISEAGYKKVEQALFARVEAAEAGKAQVDPIVQIEAELAPAAGRMVSFGDNQDAREQSLASVEQAQEIIRSSNTLDEETRDEALTNLSAWSNLVETAKNFAVGAFRFMVWDRIKKVIEKVLEDAYRAALVGILITLGTIIVGLL